MVTEAVYLASQNLLGLEGMRKRMAENDRIKKQTARDLANRLQSSLFPDEQTARQTATQLRFAVEGEAELQRELSRLEAEAHRQQAMLRVGKARQEELLRELANVQGALDHIDIVIRSNQPTLNGLRNVRVEDLLHRKEQLIRSLNAYPPALVTAGGRQAAIGEF